MGNVANWKTIGRSIIKSDFLILLIRAREGVFLLIRCCDKLLWGGGGGWRHLPPTPHSHTNTNTPSYNTMSRHKPWNVGQPTCVHVYGNFQWADKFAQTFVIFTPRFFFSSFSYIEPLCIMWMILQLRTSNSYLSKLVDLLIVYKKSCQRELVYPSGFL